MNMKAPDLLGLVIRVCGFLAIVWSLWLAWVGMQMIPHVLSGEAPVRTVTGLLATAMAALGLGVVCFACADWMVALSYRRLPPDSAPCDSIATRPRDIFGIIVRTAGIAVFVYGGHHLFYGVADAIGLLKQNSPGDMRAYLAFGVPAVLFGSAMVGGAATVVALSYKRALPDSAPRDPIAIRPRDIFGIILRTAGIAVFLYGGYYLIYGVADAIGLLKEDSPGEMRSYLLFGIPAALFGLAMVGGAQVVVSFSYYLSDRRSDGGN